MVVHYARPGKIGDPICGYRFVNVDPITTRDWQKVTCQTCVARVTVGFADMGKDWRERLIHAMRRERINDQIIGNVLGITRERVRQLGGNVHQDPNHDGIVKHAWWVQFDAEKFLEDVASGEYSVSEACGRHSAPYGRAIGRWMAENGLAERYRKARKEASWNRLRKRMKGFAEHLKERGIDEYDTCDLLAYDASLYSLTSRTGRLVEFSREVGLRYATGENRLAKGRDTVVDGKFERRRRI